MWHQWQNFADGEKDGQHVSGVRDAVLAGDERAACFAAMGAAGALSYGGFACIANRRRAPQEALINGRSVLYSLVESFSPESAPFSNLHLLTPGSVMQIWKSSDIYESLALYMLGVNNERPNLPSSAGHSLICSDPTILDTKIAKFKG
jgi:hypothetical protein